MDLSTTPRAHNSTEIVSQITKLFMNSPVQEWSQPIAQVDIPVFFESFAGLIYTFMSLIFDNSTVDMIGPFLMETMGVPQDSQQFVLEEYVPELRFELNKVILTDEEKEDLTEKLIGTVTKLLYAFAWQEDTFPLPILLGPFANILGATMLKYVNMFANNLTSFPTYDISMQNGTDAYPGSEWCNDQQPHAKWHLESANGLLDLVYLSDHVNLLIKQKLHPI